MIYLHHRMSRCTESSPRERELPCVGSSSCWCHSVQTLRIDRNECQRGCGRLGVLQDEPASLETKRLEEPTVATPTKMRGVALPDVPDVVSNVTKETPILSLLYPDVSVASAT